MQSPTKPYMEASLELRWGGMKEREKYLKS